MIRKNAPNALATHIGHLDRNRQGQQSTQPQASGSPVINSPQVPVHSSDLDDISPSSDEWTTSAFVKLVPMTDANHSDATGRFPVPSSRGNQYILVSVFNNYVHLEPMPSRSAESYLRAFKATLSFFAKLNHHITVQRMDNETSGQLEDFFRTQGVTVEYAPAQNHRTVKADRAIRDAKILKQVLIEK